MTASPSTLPAPTASVHTLPAVHEAPPAQAVRPRSATVALYSAGMAIGFLLAALASAPGGGAMVAWQLGLAAVAGVVCLVAARRARSQRRAARTVRRRPEAREPQPVALRRAA